MVFSALIKHKIVYNNYTEFQNGLEYLFQLVHHIMIYAYWYSY